MPYVTNRVSDSVRKLLIHDNNWSFHIFSHSFLTCKTCLIEVTLDTDDTMDKNTQKETTSRLRNCVKQRRFIYNSEARQAGCQVGKMYGTPTHRGTPPQANTDPVWVLSSHGLAGETVSLSNIVSQPTPNRWTFCKKEKDVLLCK